MKVKKSQIFAFISSFSVFILLYYCYMNSLRKYAIPASAITVPLLLVFVGFSVFTTTNMRIKMYGNYDKLLCGTWIIIGLLIIVDNYSLSEQLISGGMIQLFVMVCFLICMNSKSEWIESWFSIAVFFGIFNALATIIFYFNSSIYMQFIRMFFESSTIKELIGYYNKGYMCGLCTHFSSNGMVLGICILIVFEKLKRIFGNKETDVANKTLKKIFYLISLLLILYALFLSSKRAPLISAVVTIVFTLIISSGKNIFKRIALVLIGAVAVILLYNIMINVIPGLDTIANKFVSLEDSDAGVLNGRDYLWSIAFEMIDKSPIVGMGYGSYSAYANEVNSFTSTAHNYYIQVTAELGFVGLALYIFAFVIGIVYTIKLIIKTNKMGADKIEVSWLCVSLEIQLFVVIYSFTATSLYYYSILIPFMMACTIPRVVMKKHFIQNNILSSEKA